jgi:hypothetical protein
MNPIAHFLRTLALAAGIAAVAAPPLAGAANDDISAAERALFLDSPLADLKPPLTLHYRYRRQGSLEAGFDDEVTLSLTAQADGRCCATSTAFLSGERRLKLPDIEDATGNPVILHFLERDIREMQRLTKGQQNYFRKRIRMAAFDGAVMRDVSLPYRGRTVAAREIELNPYADDPLRARFEKLADKRYVFTLSAAVPGGVYSIRSRTAGATPDAPPLIVEELLADGASSAITPSKP